MANQNIKKLYRSESDRVIAGVCGGIAEYFNFDPNILRLILFVISFVGGSGIILYFVAWLIIPSKSTKKSTGEDQIKQNAKEIRERARKLTKSNSKMWVGILLLIFGISFLFQNFGMIRPGIIIKFWPLALIAIALTMLTNDGKK